MRTLFDAPAIPVGELCRRIKNAIESAFVDRVRVTGEISQCMVGASGHVYFGLKDRDGLIKCVCFRGTASTLEMSFPVADGSAVEVAGRVTAYRERSQFQLVVDDIIPLGRGELYRRFELLKEKLQRDGLFDEARKRPLPAYVQAVAIVTSRGAAALQDFLTTCRRRGGHVTVTLVHAPVQGYGAAPQLADAIVFAGSLPVDAVVVARGGGSIEDLWAFNTEVVARAIVRCAKPVISAIGHETDVTIADFAADRRAATPTAAAEMVTPDRRKLLNQLDACERRLGRLLVRAVAFARRRIDRAANDLVGASQSIVDSRAQLLDEFENRVRLGDPRRRTVDFRRRIASARQRLSVLSARSFIGALQRVRDTEERHRFAFAKTIIERTNAVDISSAKLFALGPAGTLRRGYAIVHDARGAILTDSAHTRAGESLDITLGRGKIAASVTATEDRHDEDRYQEEA